MEKPDPSCSKCGVVKLVPNCACSSSCTAPLAVCVEKHQFQPCTNVQCTTEELTLVGQPVRLADGPMTSSGMAHKFTRPYPDAIFESPDHLHLLLGDSTLENSPVHVRQLFLLFDKKKLSQAHILFLLIYVVALECGFITQTKYEKCCNQLMSLQSSMTFNAPNVMLCCRHKPTYEVDASESCFYINLRLVLHKPLDGKDKRVNSLLTALITGEYMIVTLTPDPVTQLIGRSCCLSISRYVINKLVANRGFEHSFRKLDQLSTQLRNEIFIPIRNSQLEFIQKFPFPSLIGLPRELLAHIFKYFDKNTLNKLSNVNTIFRDEIQRLSANKGNA